MLGIKCEVENTLIAETALNNGLLLVPAADNIIRLLPPLNTEKKDIEEFFNLLNITLENLPR
jgi:acetylornithine/N-succinyldiaminopimelate aminotransferase